MTHPPQFTGSREAIQLLAEHGFDGLAAALALLLSEVMKLERIEVLQAAPYQRTEDRKGYANGFKSMALAQFNQGGFEVAGGVGFDGCRPRGRMRRGRFHGDGFHPYFTRDGKLRPGLEFLTENPKLRAPWEKV